MFQNIGAQRGETVSDETLPAGVFPLLMFQSIPDSQQYEAEDYKRLPFTEAVTDIAELSQPGIGEVVDVNIVEGADQPGQRDIPLRQPHERKDERAEGEEQRQGPALLPLATRPSSLARRSHGTQSARKTLNSPGVLAPRSDTQTRLVPSGENMGKLLNCPSNVSLSRPWPSSLIT
jgi:hypothetical protein